MKSILNVNRTLENYMLCKLILIEPELHWSPFALANSSHMNSVLHNIIHLKFTFFTTC